jgi:TDG/mug DNA glycosylase family protein
MAGAPVWVLPNPSGLNAHFTLDALVPQFRALRRAADAHGDPPRASKD